ncbi:hypothetical protein [Bacillus sp. FJAT-27245]|uniref:hypothetical protein n=1 Tax=Bacillus sp. FJAT-27245 TaxID=1684144 RepID=UPI0006A7B93E|nr:hypothetical protein [Bacillus sp. FJAT-27245]
MKLIGKSPYFTIKEFELGLEETAKFLYSFLDKDDLILFPYFEGNLRYEEEEWKSFISSREVFRSETWSFGNAYHENVIWISPRNPQELLRIIENEESNFMLYVLSSIVEDIQDYKYEIYVAEHTVDDETSGNEEFVAMFIKERNNGNFEEKVLPTLRKKFSF